jgi:MFS family permease
VFRAWYLVLVLDFQYFLQAIDIAIVSLLVGPIESALHISDVGFATIAATPLAIAQLIAYYPAGLFADRFNRRNMVAVASAVWTCGALIGARAQMAPLFFMARLLAGAGISASTPPGFSMVTDAFPPERRAQVFAVFDAVYAIGSGVALIVCGLIVEAATRHGTIVVFGITVAPWQQAFLAVAALGAIGTILTLSVREPERRGVSPDHVFSIRETVHGFGRYVSRHRTLWTLYPLAIALFNTSYVSILTWGPAFGVRRFGVSNTEAATLLGVLTSVCTFAGASLAGASTQRLINLNRSQHIVRLLAVSCCIGALFSLLLPFVTTWWLAAALMGVVMGTSMANICFGSIGVQQAAPNQVRGQIIAIFGITQFLSPFVGPTLVALLTEHVFKTPGGLGTSLALVCAAVNGVAAVMFASCALPFVRAMRECLPNAA